MGQAAGSAPPSGVLVLGFFVHSSSLLVWGGRCPSVRLRWAAGQGLCLLASGAELSVSALAGARGLQQLPQRDDVGLSDSEKLVF